MSNEDFYSLEFNINGGSNGGQKLMVAFLNADHQLVKNPLELYTASGTITADAWEKVLLFYTIQFNL
jgi:hypothetical protein